MSYRGDAVHRQFVQQTLVTGTSWYAVLNTLMSLVLHVQADSCLNCLLARGFSF